MKWLKRIGLQLGVTVVALALLFTVGAPVLQNLAGQSQVAQKALVTIGFAGEAYAVTPDYQVDGVADDVQVQQALNALPPTGGRLVLFAGNYVFAATVSRAINNITIEGDGKGTYLAYNAATPLFTAGSQTGWVFKDFRTDAGYLTIAADTAVDMVWNVTQLVRGSVSYVIAASDSSLDAKAQADVVVGNNELSAAIAAAVAAGYLNIELAAGTFNETATITAPAWLYLHGQGLQNTVISSTSLVNDIIDGNTVDYVHIEGMKLAYNTANWTALAAWQIDVTDGNYWTINDVAIVLGGGATTKGTTNVYSGIRLTGNATTCWQNTLDNILFAYGFIKLDQATDNLIQNCLVNALYHNVGMLISGSSGNRIIGSQFINGNGQCVTINGQGNSFVGNQVDHAGGTTSIYLTGGGNNVVSGNYIYNSASDSILVNDSDLNAITGNTIYDSAYQVTGKHDIYLQNGSTYNTITGNTFQSPGDGIAGAAPANAIAEAAAADNYNIIAHNTINPANYSGAIIVKAGANTKVYGNQGYVTENSGTATLLNAQTSVVFAHNMDITPTAVAIAWKENPTNAIGDWWWTADAANITLNSVDPGASNLDFSWDAK